MTGERRTVAVVAGEDAAPEAVAAAIEVVDAAGAPIDWVYPPVGTPAEATHGSPFPDGARDVIDAADTTLFGATSGPSLGAMVHLRFGRRAYANIRPARYLPGARSPLRRPDGIDLVIVRENLEGLYVGAEGDLAALEPLGHSSVLGGGLHDQSPGRYAIKAATEAGTRRIASVAADHARRRDGRVTIAVKHNILYGSDGYFRDVAAETLADVAPDVEVESLHVDDTAHRLVVDPQRFDVILTMNLYGDILSDLCAGLVGGLGLAPSGCYGDESAYFEPIHGTAPDLVGLGTINPTGQILSAVMMLDHIGLATEARRIEDAVGTVYAEGRALTRDQGGAATTAEFTAVVIDALG